MRYPNAYRGVKKIFIALLISFGLDILSMLIILIINAVGVYDFYSGIPYKIFDFASIFALYLFYILMLLGVLEAGRDERIFRSACVPLCIRLGLYFIYNSLSLVTSYVFHNLISNLAMTWFSMIYRILAPLLSVWIWLSIIDGCIALANELEARGLVRFGSVLRWLLPIPCVLSLISSFILILQVMNSNLLQSLYETVDHMRIYRWQEILSRCASVLNLLMDVLLLICLGCTLRLLRNQAPEIKPETEIAP